MSEDIKAILIVQSPWCWDSLHEEVIVWQKRWPLQSQQDSKQRLEHATTDASQQHAAGMGEEQTDTVRSHLSNVANYKRSKPLVHSTNLRSTWFGIMQSLGREHQPQTSTPGEQNKQRKSLKQKGWRSSHSKQERKERQYILNESAKIVVQRTPSMMQKNSESGF